MLNILDDVYDYVHSHYFERNESVIHEVDEISSQLNQISTILRIKRQAARQERIPQSAPQISRIASDEKEEPLTKIFFAKKFERREGLETSDACLQMITEHRKRFVNKLPIDTTEAEELVSYYQLTSAIEDKASEWFGSAEGVWAWASSQYQLPLHWLNQLLEACEEKRKYSYDSHNSLHSAMIYSFTIRFRKIKCSVQPEGHVTFGEDSSLSFYSSKFNFYVTNLEELTTFIEHLIRRDFFLKNILDIEGSAECFEKVGRRLDFAMTSFRVSLVLLYYCFTTENAIRLVEEFTPDRALTSIFNMLLFVDDERLADSDFFGLRMELMKRYCSPPVSLDNPFINLNSKDSEIFHRKFFDNESNVVISDVFNLIELKDWPSHVLYMMQVLNKYKSNSMTDWMAPISTTPLLQVLTALPKNMWSFLLWRPECKLHENDVLAISASPLFLNKDLCRLQHLLRIKDAIYVVNKREYLEDRLVINTNPHVFSETSYLITAKISVSFRQFLEVLGRIMRSCGFTEEQYDAVPAIRETAEKITNKISHSASSAILMNTSQFGYLSLLALLTDCETLQDLLLADANLHSLDNNITYVVYMCELILHCFKRVENIPENFSNFFAFNDCKQEGNDRKQQPIFPCYDVGITAGLEVYYLNCRFQNK